VRCFILLATLLDWERRSGATFEAEKTAIIHFTKSEYKSDTDPFVIKGQEVRPKAHIKILGLTMDTRLKYKEHIGRERGNSLRIQWLRASCENELIQKAKEEARKMTRGDVTRSKQLPAIKSTSLNIARQKQPATTCLPDKVGKYSKRIDVALPGKHTKVMYDQLGRKEASLLVQLRTGMARVNDYLHRIQAAPSDLCACGQARETIEHFIFTCTHHPHLPPYALFLRPIPPLT
jgi:hypothetical protein